MNMNVKKSSFRNFDKENHLCGSNKLNAYKTTKKSGRTGEEIRRRMQIPNVPITSSKAEPYQSLKLNNMYLNQASSKYPNYSALRKSVDYLPALQSSRSSKSVHFEEAHLETSLTRKHSSSSILKSKSNLRKSTISDRGSMKSSICSNIGQTNQSCENYNMNKLIRQKYESILARLTKTNSKYTDELYPPLTNSIASKKSESQYKEVTWMRLGDLFSGKYLTVYNKEPLSYFVSGNQRFAYTKSIANCFNSIKHNNFLLEKMFESQQYNKYGIYLLKVNQNNNWKYIIVDDYVPVTIKQEGYKKKYECAFLNCQSVNPKNLQVQIWPYLLQKAYAKYYGTYESFKYVNQIDFLQQLTCCPVEEINLSTETIPKILQQMQNFDTIFMCKDKLNQFHSIVPRKMQITLEEFDSPHTYSIQTYQEDYFMAKCTKVYCVFLHKYFYTGNCTIKQSNKNDKAENVSIRYFKLEEHSQCVLSLIQKDMKHYQIGYEYCWMRMIIAQKESENNYRWVTGAYKRSKITSCKVSLQPGQYFILIFPEWRAKPFDFSLVMYANSICQIERKSYMGNQNILIEAAMDLAQRNGKMKQLNQNICTYSFIERDLAMVIENINNERPNGHIRILRSVQGLLKSKKYQVKAFNKQFKKQHTIQVKINSLQHYTVVLGLLGGHNTAFLDQFDFGS